MDTDWRTQARLQLLRRYMGLLKEQGLLKDEDATCKLFALIDDDRKQMYGELTFPTLDPNKKLLPPEEVLADIQAHPEAHKHTFDDLYRCSVVASNNPHGYVLDVRVLEAHHDIVRPGCDVTEGSCACGAIHLPATQPAAG